MYLFWVKRWLFIVKKMFFNSFFLLQLQFWQTIDCLRLQLIHCPSVFLGMLQSAISQQTCNGLDVGTIIQNIHSKTVASTMPTNVFVDSCTFYPPFHRFTATLIRGKIKYGRIQIVRCFTYQWKQSVVQRNNYTTMCRMPFGFILLKFK